MNCNKCKAEWTPPDGVSIDKCPFCGNPLFEISNSKKNAEPHEILLNIVQQYDKNKLGDTLLKGILSDLMPHVGKKYQRVFKQALDDKIGLKLLELENEDSSMQNIKLNTLRHSFKNNNGFDSTADYVVDCFLFALGWIDTVNKEQYSHDSADNLSDIAQQIDMAFIDGVLNRDESTALFSISQKLGLTDNVIVDLINAKIKSLKLVPNPPTPKSIKSQKEIICASDWSVELKSNKEKSDSAVKLPDAQKKSKKLKQDNVLVKNDLKDIILKEKSLIEKDELFEDAAYIVVQNQECSIGLIQRKFNIGFNRGTRIVDQLWAAGIVEPWTGVSNREVIVRNQIDLKQFLNNSNKKNCSQIEYNAEERDELFADAANIVVKNQECSIGLIQRKFNIGFNRGTRIVDQLWAAGIVEPWTGVSNRKVKVNN